MSALNEEEVEWNYHSLGTKKKPPKNQMQSKATTLSNIQSLNLTYLIKYLAKYFGKCSFPLLHLPLYSRLNLQQRLCSRRMAVCVWWKCSCSLWHSGGMEPLLAAAGGGLPSSDHTVNTCIPFLLPCLEDTDQQPNCSLLRLCDQHFEDTRSKRCNAII